MSNVREVIPTPAVGTLEDCKYHWGYGIKRRNIEELPATLNGTTIARVYHSPNEDKRYVRAQYIIEGQDNVVGWYFWVEWGSGEIIYSAKDPSGMDRPWLQSPARADPDARQSCPWAYDPWTYVCRRNADSAHPGSAITVRDLVALAGCEERVFPTRTIPGSNPPQRRPDADYWQLMADYMIWVHNLLFYFYDIDGLTYPDPPYHGAAERTRWNTGRASLLFQLKDPIPRLKTQAKQEVPVKEGTRPQGPSTGVKKERAAELRYLYSIPSAPNSRRPSPGAGMQYR